VRVRSDLSPGGTHPAGAVDCHHADGAAADRCRKRDAHPTVACEPGAARNHAALAGEVIRAAQTRDVTASLSVQCTLVRRTLAGLQTIAAPVRPAPESPGPVFDRP
jgi:hypothetical protein